MPDADMAVATTAAPASEAVARLMRVATYASVAVAGTLIATKFGAWLMTDSISLLSTLIDSLLDVAASVVNLFAVRHALQPADREHRFGHGKAEALAGLAQAAFIAGSAAFLIVQAIERMIHPRPVVNTDIGIAVMVFAIVLTLLLVGFQKYVVRKTGSLAIGADSLHYQSDVLVNGSVIVSLLLSAHLGWNSLDPLFGIGIAAYILWGAWRVGVAALHVLMDRELPEEDRRRIRAIAQSRAEVRGVHDLRTRSAGSQMFIQLHLEFDGAMTLHQVLVASEAVMHEIQAAYPNAEVIIHEDPEGVDEPRASFQ
jgi:ferrous-iron efflux pump FieF